MGRGTSPSPQFFIYGNLCLIYIIFLLVIVCGMPVWGRDRAVPSNPRRVTCCLLGRGVGPASHNPLFPPYDLDLLLLLLLI